MMQHLIYKLQQQLLVLKVIIALLVQAKEFHAQLELGTTKQDKMSLVTVRYVQLVLLVLQLLKLLLI